MAVPGPLQYVPVAVLRQTFNNLRFYERRLAGEFRPVLVAERHVRPGPHDFPHCTNAQEEVYYDASGTPVAKVHQYRLPNGSLGASGRPDPRWVFDGKQRLAFRATP